MPGRSARARALVIVGICAGLAAACAGPAADRGTTEPPTSTNPTEATSSSPVPSTSSTIETPPGPSEAVAVVTAVPSSLDFAGTAEVSPDVVRVPLSEVATISPDGVRFSLRHSGTMAVGSVFLVPGVAARKVVTVVDAAGPVVDTEPAALSEIFSDLDVTFRGVPDTARVMTGSAPAEAGTFQELPRLRTPMSTFRSALPASAAEPCKPSTPGAAKGDAGEASVSEGDAGESEGDAGESEGASGDGTDAGGGYGTDAGGGDGTDAGEEPSQFEGAGDPIRIGPYSVTVSAKLAEACPTMTFAAEIGRADEKMSLNGELSGSLTIKGVSGTLSTRASGFNGLDVDFDSTVALSLIAAGKVAGGVVDRGTATWDLVKVDIPLMVADVPIVIRVGFPFTLEARFSGSVDRLEAKLASMTCSGTVTIGATSDTGKKVCALQPPSINQYLSMAPSGFVVAVGLKVGLGLGVVSNFEAVAFAGLTGTLAGGVGVTNSGAAGMPVTACTRVDRVVSFDLGGEFELFGVTLEGKRRVWQKDDTYEDGTGC